MTQTAEKTTPAQIAVAPVLDPVRQIQRWFDVADPAPTEARTHTQIGVHLEEVSEMCSTLAAAEIVAPGEESCFGFLVEVLNHVQRKLKEGSLKLDLDAVDRTELLDALCDQGVTGIGIARMFDLDIAGGLGEVACSNDSKFDETGHPIFNEQRKIVKGPNYRKPDLSPYLTRTYEDA